VDRLQQAVIGAASGLHRATAVVVAARGGGDRDRDQHRQRLHVQQQQGRADGEQHHHHLAEHQGARAELGARLAAGGAADQHAEGPGVQRTEDEADGQAAHHVCRGDEHRDAADDERDGRMHQLEPLHPPLARRQRCALHIEARAHFINDVGTLAVRRGDAAIMGRGLRHEAVCYPWSACFLMTQTASFLLNPQ